MAMAVNCSPKLVRYRGLIERVPTSAILKTLQGYFSRIDCQLVSCRSFSFITASSLAHLESPTVFVLSKCQPTVTVGGRRAYMSSWLTSSRVLFRNGSGGDNGNDGNDTDFPNIVRRFRGRELGETSILCQDGDQISEVPAAVLRTAASEKKRKGPPTFYVVLDPKEEAAFVDGFSSYHTPKQVLKMLDTIPSQEVTPFVSYSILKKLFELENNFGFRNEGRSWTNTSENNVTDTFTRLAVVTRLIDTILTSENSTLLLDTLDLLRHESPQINDSSHVFDVENQLDYRNKVLQEVLVRVTEGKLDLEQVCRAVVILGKTEEEKNVSFSRDFIDKFWVGILDHSDDINADNITEVMRTVKYFKKSSRLVLNLAERKLFSLWWRMSTATVAEICSIITSSDSPFASPSEKSYRAINTWQIPSRLLTTLCKCTNLNIHKVTEKELSTIVHTMNTYSFCDSAIEQALNKYMKAKCLKISDPQLVANIMDFTNKFRLRSTNILEAAAQFVVKNGGSNLSPPHLTSILKPYGELDFEPSQGPKFWEIVENFLNDKFIQFPPKDIIQLFLACVYLKKYPLNFVDRTFSPYFLDRLHTSESDFTNLQQHRSNLKLLDTAMTIECRNKYAGPLLPKDFSSRTIFIDGRVGRMTTVVKETLMGICKQSSIDTSIILPCLPLNSLFSADVLLTTPKIESEVTRNMLLRSHINSKLLYTDPQLESRSSDFTIVLVNIPEHFSSDGQFLVGPQSLRKRLLQSLGFKVVNLRYKTLAEAKGDFNSMTEYIEKKLKDVDFPL